MVRITTKTRQVITGAARRGAKGIRSVAGDALGAAANAAAAVVLESTANALDAGRAKIRQSTPALKRAAGKTAKQAVNGSRRKKPARKRRAKSRRRTSRRSR
jgi:hypothetical protein